MLSQKVLDELRIYINEHLFEVMNLNYSESRAYPVVEKEAIIEELESFIKRKKEASFTEVLFEFIDRDNLKDSDVYNKVGMDRRHFSKIRSNPEYRVSKPTAIVLAIALELDEQETEKLLSAAGFTLSGNDTFDLVIRFCMERQVYDIDEVNQALDYLGLKTL